MGSMIPQLFMVVELWAVICQKWSQNPGGPKIAKNGEKWPAKMTCKNGESGFLNLHHRIAITLTFAKCLVAI